MEHLRRDTATMYSIAVRPLGQRQGGRQRTFIWGGDWNGVIQLAAVKKSTDGYCYAFLILNLD